jgi:nicotinate-nucleotide--dimethylbenzimidazole phosphoribosyltransferase
MAAARAHQDRLTKPPGSLGRLEDLAVQLAGAQRRPIPVLDHTVVVVMAADHGVAAEGVSPYPQVVTGQMVANFLAGGAAVNVLARQAGARVVVVDVGLASPASAHPALIRAPIGPGTANLLHGPAMSRVDAERAIALGVATVESEEPRGLHAVVLGDMGIANTTSGAAVVATLTSQAPRTVVGRGTGVDDVGWERKVQVVERALALHRPDPADPLAVLAAVGGFEHAALVGVALAAAAHRALVVVDGLAAAAAALAAVRLVPALRPYLVAGHASVEPGQRAALAAIDLRPLLDLDLRLGEGTGGVLALHLLVAAARLHAEMATFEQAGVSDRPTDVSANNPAG